MASILSKIAVVGECSTSDPANGTVRVTFPDRDDLVSGDLPVVYPIGGWASKNGVPEPGDNVACVFFGNGVTDGLCLGIVQEGMPGTPDQRGVWFDDGNFVMYDRSTGTFSIKATSLEFNGDVKITGDLQVTGELTIGGDATLSGNVTMEKNLHVVGKIKEDGEDIEW